MLEIIEKMEKPIVEIVDMQGIEGLRDRQIIIYGAGIYANLLYLLLELKGLEENVLCFTVSDKSANPEHICGKSVVEIEEIFSVDDDTVFIVAVKNAEPIIEKLIEKNISNIFRLPETFAAQRKSEIYHCCCNFPIQENKIFFYCYEGKGYRCNCKYIAEKFLEQDAPVQLVWVLSNEEDRSEFPKAIKTVKDKTAEYYRELYTSAVIVINSGLDRNVCKRPGQFWLNTWHGYGPFKKTHGALPNCDRERYMEEKEYYDLFVSGSRFYSWVYRTSFFYDGEIAEYGAPRNDLFFVPNHAREKIYRKYKIDPDKKLLLFAPTYRNDFAGSFDHYMVDMNQVVGVLRERFRDEFVWMYRFHHMLYETKERMEFFEEGIDATRYPDIQELLVAADVVITDYSSLMWDFSLQRKPVFLYQLDEEEYRNDHGFYAPVSEWPYPQAHSQEELIDKIRQFDEDAYVRAVDSFLEEYGSCDDGHAAERVVERIMHEMVALRGENNLC